MGPGRVNYFAFLCTRPLFTTQDQPPTIQPTTTGAYKSTVASASAGTSDFGTCVFWWSTQHYYVFCLCAKGEELNNDVYFKPPTLLIHP